MKFINSGSGSGPQTSDGCSVEFYRRLPYTDELEDIADQLREHESVLELGCGVGRLATRLLNLGLSYCGVDNSQEMLSHLPQGAEGLYSSIEALHLERSWSSVLLASHLINVPDVQLRRAFVEAAFQHLAPQGKVYIQRHNPDWLSSVEPGGLGTFSGLDISVETVERRWPYVTMTLKYDLEGQSWCQSFTAEALSVGQVEELLKGVGFNNVQTSGERELWLSAVRGDA